MCFFSYSSDFMHKQGILKYICDHSASLNHQIIFTFRINGSSNTLTGQFGVFYDVRKKQYSNSNCVSKYAIVNTMQHFKMKICLRSVGYRLRSMSSLAHSKFNKWCVSVCILLNNTHIISPVKFSGAQFSTVDGTFIEKVAISKNCISSQHKR